MRNPPFYSKQDNCRNGGDANSQNFPPVNNKEIVHVVEFKLKVFNNMLCMLYENEHYIGKYSKYDYVRISN